MANDSYNESAWESFKPDAARALRAQQGFEDAVARTLDRPFDTSSHGRVEAALDELRAATPGAIRVAELQLGGGA